MKLKIRLRIKQPEGNNRIDMENTTVFLWFIVLICFVFSSCVRNQGTLSELDFKTPPASAKPRTWMHVMDGNMSKEGLTKDLEAIAEVGIGGVLLFNISYGIPDGNILFNSDEHIALLTHAAKESERLGLTFGVHNCDGWTASGGPWITPDKSMKMVVHNHLVTDGGKKLELQLPQPGIRENYYEDIAILAYPALPSEIADFENKPSITSSQKDLNIAILSDGRNDEQTTLRGSTEKPAWIQYAYQKPISLRSLMITTKTRGPKADFFVSNDGLNFTAIPAPEVQRPGKLRYAFSAIYKGIKAKYIRMETTGRINLMEMTFSSTQLLNNTLGRISLHKTSASKLGSIGEPEKNMIINKDKIINLTRSMDAHGKLNATLPAGKWTIMRFGVTTTGAHNYPATDAGRGLEVDKYNKRAVKTHYDAFVGKLVREAQPDAPDAFRYVEIDSYEMGGQNWTFGYDSIFESKFNYNLLPFLPLFAGRFVESAEASDAVLWDVRKLNSDLMVENYFGYFTDLSNKDHLKTYIEPYGNGPFDNLASGGKADIPMGEFWLGQSTTITQPAVDAARIYGKNIISMESFTSRPELNWKGHPAINKPTGDRIWTLGANEFVFHRFVHQANTHVKPGMTMGHWGSHIDRTNTWWKSAGKAWFTYLARGQYMLRQGVPVCDFLVFAGDRSPNPSFNPHLPSQYTSGAVNADVLIHRISVKNGKMGLPEGNQFQGLILGKMKAISLKTLQRINELAAEGVTLIGEKPQGLTGYLKTSKELETFHHLVESIWSKPTTYDHYNWDKILAAIKLKPAFEVTGQREMAYAYRKTPNEDIFFFYNADSTANRFECTFNINGKIPELWNAMTGETVKMAQFTQKDGRTIVPIYLDGMESVFVVFRESSNGVTVLSSAENDNDEAARFTLTSQGEVELMVHENGRYTAKKENGKEIEITVDDIPSPITIDGTWRVKFNAESGFSAELSMPQLKDWSTSEIDEVRHYSGTAIYNTSFKIEPEILKNNRQFELNLGKVYIAAKVKLNGVDLGIVWMMPYQLDATSALKEGENELEIEVTNLWTNRLIGDERFEDTSGFDPNGEKMPAWYIHNEPLPAGKRTTFTTKNFYENDRNLLPSGLLGPVSIKIVKKEVINIR